MLDVTVSGVALTTDGLVANDAIALSPIALVTFGFLSGCPDIWNPTDLPITTVWTNSNDQTTVETCTGD